MYDIIVFEILGIHTYTRKRKAGVFKNLNLGELFLKRCVFGDCFHRTRVDGRPNRRKNLRLKKKKRIRVNGAWTCYVFCRSCLRRSRRYLIKSGFH